ncbi:hypothetical protein [Acetivibrio cellulolyticus]|uniref:hypothetical protein n=1 Tax=Acetivibrio cellulolyticus TaxID=35830 RepID=UPI0001E2DE2D|nr:hypothetical protein [Acetivibrio cellulolyticus]
MKEWILPVRIILMLASYFLSLVLFMNTSAFDYGDFWTSFITVNVIAVIIIAMCFGVSRNALTPTFVVCMGFCVPSLMAYSKLGAAVFDIDVKSNFNAFFTAIFFVTIILMFLSAGKLKRQENEYISLVSNGADEEAVKNIVINSLKVFFAFLAPIFVLTIVAITFGFIVLNVEGSMPVAIMTAIIGIALFSGSMYYLSRKWSNQSRK